MLLITSATSSSASLTEAPGSSTNLLWISSQWDRKSSASAFSNKGAKSSSLVEVLFSSVLTSAICSISLSPSGVLTTSTFICFSFSSSIIFSPSCLYLESVPLAVQDFQIRPSHGPLPDASLPWSRLHHLL